MFFGGRIKGYSAIFLKDNFFSFDNGCPERVNKTGSAFFHLCLFSCYERENIKRERLDLKNNSDNCTLILESKVIMHIRYKAQLIRVCP